MSFFQDTHIHIDEFFKKAITMQLKHLNVTDIKPLRLFGLDYCYLSFDYKGIEFYTSVELKSNSSEVYNSNFFARCEENIWSECDKFSVVIFDEEQPTQRIKKLLETLGYYLSVQLSEYQNIHSPGLKKTISADWINENVFDLYEKGYKRSEIFLHVKNLFLFSDYTFE